MCNFNKKFKPDTNPKAIHSCYRKTCDIVYDHEKKLECSKAQPGYGL